ncbi:PstS family phosphate ABC transporter substrate-binding protein [Duganella sp. Dugasp56]|uniref:PstS family phosphate ABC transporter substrate-binding protein n=1 Tax=Duganella sp. Dugasp56 TaxID=3243046 RepID=UPI0039B08D4B
MVRRRLLSGLGALLLCGAAWAQIDAHPAPNAGLIRTWGHGSRDRAYAGGLVAAWQRGFQRNHPGVRFETTLRGTSTGIGGLYTGAADLALMERAPIAIELDAYVPLFKAEPSAVSIATGSLDVAHHNPALVVYVHQDNPLTRLTLAELDGVIGADRRRAGRQLRTWGDLGLKGAWAQRPIHVYITPIAGDDAQFIEHAVMGDSQKWAGDLREFADAGGIDGGQRVLDALAADPGAIAISTMVYRNARARPLALSAGDGAPYVAASRETVANRSYPLARGVTMTFNRPLAPHIKAYLDYILSDEGQAAIARDGGYFPLQPAAAQAERSKLQ